MLHGDLDSQAIVQLSFGLQSILVQRIRSNHNHMNFFMELHQCSVCKYVYTSSTDELQMELHGSYCSGQSCLYTEHVVRGRSLSLQHKQSHVCLPFTLQ